jgi:ADP-ribosylglycohydrolase
MIGAIIGDIVGSAWEMKFSTPVGFPLFMEKSRFTDDTVLTFATAQAIMRPSLSPYPRRFAQQYKQWGTNFPDRGYGSKFKEWVKLPKFPVINSYADGCMMRCSPIAMFYEDKELALKRALQSIAYTHASPESARGVQSIVDAIWMARHGATKDEIKVRVQEQYGHMLNQTLMELRAKASKDIRCNLVAPQALTCFMESKDFESAIRNAVFIGGDTDTNAAIAGALAEAFYGLSNIPLTMVTQATSYLTPEMIGMMNTFYGACQPFKAIPYGTLT